MALPVPSIVSWPQQPMVRVLLLFFAGILLTELHPIFSPGVQMGICWVFLTVILFRLRKRKKVSGNGTLFNGTTISLLVILIGSLSARLRDPVSRQDYFCASDEKTNKAFLVKILPEPVIKNAALKFNGEIVAVNENGKSTRRTGGLRVIVKQPGNSALKTGDEVWVYGEAVVADEALLPGTFDMRKWMALEGVGKMITISASALKKQDEPIINLRRLAIDWRKSLIKKLSANGLKGNELAVASALILGERSEIDRETLTDYSTSGIVHILAVSGLHVGLIYAGLLLILGRSRKLKNSWTGALICLSALWLYAMMTGLSASVLRAAVMYSFIAISSVRKVSLSPFNALSASAFILLAFNPWIWKNIGFQLSYAAVWGIISFQKPILTLFNPQMKLARYLNESIAISVSAQVSTTPLTFYVFGSFPVYFLAANLVAIPFSTLLTYTGIAAIILADIPLLGEFLASCLGLGIRFLNGIADVVSSLPNASATNLFISVYGMLFSALLLVQLSLILQHFTARRLIIGLLLVLIISGESVYRKMNLQHKSEMVLFSKNGNLNLLHIHEGQSRHYISGQNMVSNQVETEIQLFLRRSYEIDKSSGRFIAQVNDICEPHLFKLAGLQILFIDSHLLTRDSRDSLQRQLICGHVNVLLVARKCSAADEEFLSEIRPDAIIITPFLKKAEHKAWIKIASARGIKFLDFPFKGRLHVSLYQ